MQHPGDSALAAEPNAASEAVDEDRPAGDQLPEESSAGADEQRFDSGGGDERQLAVAGEAKLDADEAKVNSKDTEAEDAGDEREAADPADPEESPEVENQHSAVEEGDQDNDDDSPSSASESPTTGGEDDDEAGELSSSGSDTSASEQATVDEQAADEAVNRRSKQNRTSFDRRQEKFSEMKATVKTFDINMEAIIGKWKRVREDFLRLKANSVLASGNDGSLIIQRRLTEIGNMCSSTTSANFYLSTLPKKIQGTVRQLHSLSAEQFTRMRRQNWTPLDRVLYAGRMARVLSQACLVRRRLIQERPQEARALSEKDIVACAIGKNVRDCMTYRPKFRTKEMRQKILWYLRTSKAFSHIFSSEMEEECTKFVFYEKYQDGRLLSLANRQPQKFYFVISGKIEKRKTYELRAGDYNRVLASLTKGQCSSVEEIELQKQRKFTWSARGVTEVLTLEKDAFVHLLRGTGGLPLKFILNVSIFREFPCEKFEDNPEAIVTRYFPKDRIVLQDISDTPWIHLIKSGSAKVVRKQLVFANSRNKYNAQREIGFGSVASHSDDMLGISHRQRRCKAAAEAGRLRLPPIGAGSNPLSFTIGVVGEAGTSAPSSAGSGSAASADDGGDEVDAVADAKPAPASEVAPAESGGGGKKLQHPVNLAAREVRIPVASAASLGRAWRPQSRRRAAKTLLGEDGFPPIRPQREALVVVDRLRSGDFLGFHNITMLIENEKIARDKDGALSLISDGAEVILISKRFFVQHAANNTLLKAETLTRDVVTVNEASVSMDARDDWQMFKAAFSRRLAERRARTRQCAT